MDIIGEEEGLESQIAQWKKVLEDLKIIRKQCFQILVKVYEGFEIDNF